MSEEIRPALSAEEWAEATDPSNAVLPLTRLQWAASEVGKHDAVSIPALAALALQHAGPDGGAMFTWEDVDVLRFFAKNHYWIGDMDRDTTAKIGRKAGALADRIAALLPPRGP